MKSTDRRVLRTKRALHEAILGLLQEQSYTSLTVRDLTERADVNRATFYLHYRDKEQLLIEALDAHFEALSEDIAERMKAHPLMDNPIPNVMLFEHVAAHQDMYRVFLSDSGPGFVMQRMIDAMVSFGQEHFLSQYTEEMRARLPFPAELISHHICGALFALLRWWLQNDMPYPAEQMAQTAHELSMQGVWQLLGLEL